MPGSVPVPSQADDLLGHLAVECGLVTEAQLRLAQADRERGTAPSLAETLLRRGLVTQATLGFLLELRARPATERARLLTQRKADLALARELLARGLLTPGQVNDCLLAQVTSSGTTYVPLPEVIESRGLLGHEDLRTALPAQSTRVLICKACRAELTVFAYPFPITYRCRNCNAPVDSSSLTEGQATIEISAGFRNPRADPVPPGVPVPPAGSCTDTLPPTAPAAAPSLRDTVSCAPAGHATEPPQRSYAPADAPAPAGAAAPEPAPPPGRPFGKYVITGELGRGGMGIVYRAFQTELRREVALKALTQGGHEETEVKRFYNEARLAARLVHPNIVPIFDVGIHDGTHYFTMELIDGPPLIELLDGKKLDVARLLGILREVAQGVQYAHDQGIVHRDLKPQNILIDAAGKPRITDFGLARELSSKDRMTVSGTIMGTPSYMSPEQANGDREAIGPKSDVYSLGAILYHGLCGRPPHEGSNLIETVYKVIDREPEPIRNLNPKAPSDVITLCMKALEKEPARRYGSAAALADDLRRYLEGEPIQARPTGSIYRVVKRMRKNRALTAVSFLAALLALGGGTWFIIKDARDREDKARIAREKADQERRREEAKKIYDRASHHKPKDAIELLTKALEISPDYAEAWFMRGLHRRSINDFEGALADFTEAIKHNRMFTNAYLYRALVYDENLRKKEEAMKDYAEIVKIDPESAIGYLCRAKSLAGDNQHEEAVKDYTRAIDKDPNYTEAYLNRAESESRLNAFDAALRDVAKALELEPQSHVAHVVRGRIHETMHRLRDAIVDFTDALQLQPLYPDALTARGYARANLDDLDAALSDFQAAYALQHSNLSAISGVAFVLIKRDKYEEARPWVERELALNSKSVSGWNNKGLLLGGLKDHKGAIEALTRAIELEPTSEHPWRNRASQYFDIGRYDEAVEDLGHALEANPQMARAYSLRGACYIWLKKWLPSIRDWEKFLELSPSDRFRNDGTGGIGTCKMYLAARGKPVVTARDHLEAGRKKLESGDKAGAALEYQAAAEFNPGLYTPDLMLARLHAGEGRVKDAVAALVRAAQRGFVDFGDLAREPAMTRVMADPRVIELRR